MRCRMATLVLIAWPFVAIALFAALGRERGLIWATVIGYLFLPETALFDLPLLPPYNKLSALALGLVLGAFLYRSRKSWPDMPGPIDDNRTFRILLVGLFSLLCVGALFTILTNGNTLVDGGRVRSGMSIRDLVGLVSGPAVLMVPFFLAWRWLYTEVHHREILLAVVVLGLFYSCLALFELRISPQLNSWLYGFFPHEWRQHLRAGGYRPVVFLRHGLWLGIFLFAATMAGFALFRYTKSATRFLYLLAGFWILAVLLLSRNLGVAMLAVLFIPCLLLLPKTLHLYMTMLITVLFLAYPVVRQANLLPLDGFLNFAASIDSARAQSLEFRMRNEDAILARAAEKPAFGWGGWGRNRIIDEKGRDTTVTDGIWVIYISERGWAGYAGFFGLLGASLLALPRVARRRPVTSATTALGLIMAANLIYLIPNSALNPIGWLMAGALAGMVQWRPALAASTGAEPETSGASRVTRYTRFAPHDRGRMAAPASYRRS